MDAIDRCVCYLVAYIVDSKTVMLDSFPVKPADLMADSDRALRPSSGARMQSEKLHVA
jgi:hypothetical protein